MSLRGKMLGLAGIPIIGLLVLVGVGGVKLLGLGRVADQLVQQEVVPLVDVEMRQINELNGSIALLLNADRDAHQALIAEKMILSADNPEDRTRLDRDNRENLDQTGQRMEKAAVFFDAGMQAEYEQFKKLLADWQEKSRKVVDYSGNPAKFAFARKISGGSGQEAFDQMRAMIDKLQTRQEERIQAALALAQEKRTRALAAGASAVSQSHSALGLFAGLAGAIILLLGLFVIRLAGSISRQVALVATGAAGFARGDLDLAGLDEKLFAQMLRRQDELGRIGRAFSELTDYLREKVAAARAIADGDLTTQVRLKSQQDALSAALRDMVRDLGGLIGQINETSDQVVSGADQVSAASQALSQGATEQAASLEEIASSVTQISSQTRTNAENAGQANSLAEAAREAAAAGTGSMDQMLAAMTKIDESSRQIAKIIKVIDDIAFQTNLLALNAAVEAARAGRHGKGFAVVAEEVRNLATRSARAASETTALIEDSLHKVGQGTEVAQRTAQALGEINDRITQASVLVAEIANASNEQAQGLGQINLGLGQIDKVTQQNTASAEETAAAAAELTGLAQHLRQILGRFQLLTAEDVESEAESADLPALPEPSRHSA